MLFVLCFYLLDHNVKVLQFIHRKQFFILPIISISKQIEFWMLDFYRPKVCLLFNLVSSLFSVQFILFSFVENSQSQLYVRSKRGPQWHTLLTKYFSLHTCILRWHTHRLISISRHAQVLAVSPTLLVGRKSVMRPPWLVISFLRIEFVCVRTQINSYRVGSSYKLAAPEVFADSLRDDNYNLVFVIHRVYEFLLPGTN